MKIKKKINRIIIRLVSVFFYILLYIENAIASNDSNPVFKNVSPIYGAAPAPSDTDMLTLIIPVMIKIAIVIASLPLIPYVYFKLIRKKEVNSPFRVMAKMTGLIFVWFLAFVAYVKFADSSEFLINLFSLFSVVMLLLYIRFFLMYLLELLKSKRKKDPISLVDKLRSDWKNISIYTILIFVFSLFTYILFMYKE